MSGHSKNDLKVLLSKVAEGDENAFGQLFKSYYNQLGDFVMRITESEPLTQEIVQDVFLKIWINRDSLLAVNSFKAYLLVVARNHTFNCLKQIAKEKYQKNEWIKTALQHADSNVEGSSDSNPDRLIDEAIDLLPPQQKKVYMLSRREGKKHLEIASEMNISLETVKKHMVLALRFLKTYLRAHINFLIFFVPFF
ncbi:RNA polymerase sigma-70 factor [Chitinophaga sp. MM2321]|uniref:RNA polymerase sigma-70 factor n=1 Tax=Chitinophaga sp. MM2321 TaxID=3137178 RepID=UPI0032D5A7F2